MLKSISLVLLSSAAFSGAASAACSSYPYTLTNGNTADASQVMANLNCAALTSGATLNSTTFTGNSNFPGSSVVDSFGHGGLGTISTLSARLTASDSGISGSYVALLATDGSGLASLGRGAVAQIYQGQTAANDVLDLAVGTGAYTGTVVYGYTNTGASSSFYWEQWRAGASGVIYEVRGDGNVYNANGTYGTISDERVKDWNIPQINYQGAIRNLWLGDFYRWNDISKAGKPQLRFGVRAQQAYSDLPAPIRDYAISLPDKTGGLYRASSEPFGFLALWGVKDLYRTTDDQTRRLADLEGEVKTYKTQVALLRHANEVASAKMRALQVQQFSEIRHLQAEFDAVQYQIKIQTAQR